MNLRPTKKIEIHGKNKKDPPSKLITCEPVCTIDIIETPNLRTNYLIQHIFPMEGKKFDFTYTGCVSMPEALECSDDVFSQDIEWRAFSPWT